MNAKIEHQKSVADFALSKLWLLDRSCIVAGGAPRDWYLGNEAKDIDIYLHDSRKEYIYADQRVDLLKEFGFDILEKYEDWTIPELYQSNHYISHLYNTKVQDENVQIIFVSEPTFTSVIDTFPISISMVWYKGKIKTTPEFDLSVKHKILWKTVDSYKEDNKYLLKIREKFSDYKYITEKQAHSYQKLEQLRQVFEETIKDISEIDVKNWLVNNL